MFSALIIIGIVAAIALYLHVHHNAKMLALEAKVKELEQQIEGWFRSKGTSSSASVTPTLSRAPLEEGSIHHRGDDLL